MAVVEDQSDQSPTLTGAEPQDVEMKDIPVTPPPLYHATPDVQQHVNRTQAPGADTLDLMHRITGMYRLLDLISEQGSGGAVDKVVIDKKSIESLANTLSPGSYVSVTKIDFQALGRQHIRPLGIYGSRASIVQFLLDAQRIDAATATLLSRRDDGTGVPRPHLRPGLYLVDGRHVSKDLFYAVFWPEQDTWDDSGLSSVSRNRVTFIRYLSKLCDQIYCLISDEHGRQLVWKQDFKSAVEEQQHSDDEDDIEGYDRLFTFKVAVTNEQEETATIHEGFTLADKSIAIPKPESSENIAAALRPKLVVGDQSQAILSVQYIPEQSKVIHSDDTVNEWQLRQRLMNPVQLDKDIDTESLRILINHGLDKTSAIYLEWKQQLDHDCRVRHDDHEKQKHELLQSQKNDPKSIAFGLMRWLAERVVKNYRTLDSDAILAALMNSYSELTNDGDTSEQYDYIARRFENDQSLDEFVQKELRKLKLESIQPDGPKGRFQSLKGRLRHVEHLLRQDNDVTTEEVQALARVILTQGSFREEYTSLVGVGDVDSREIEPSERKSFRAAAWLKVKDWFSRPDEAEARKASKAFFNLTNLSDQEFLRSLPELVERHPAFVEVVAEIQGLAQGYLSSLLGSLFSGPFVSQLQHHMNLREKLSLEDSLRRSLDAEERRSWEALKAKLIEETDTKETRPSIIILRAQQIKGRYTLGTQIHLQAQQVKTQPASFQYTFHPFLVTTDDKQRVSNNPRYVCQPKIPPNNKPTFELPCTSSISFMRLVGQERCLLVVRDITGTLSVFLEDILYLGNTLKASRSKRQLVAEKVGPAPLIAFDEAHRLLVIYVHVNDQALLHVFAFDQLYSQLTGRGSAINLSGFFSDGVPPMRHLGFVSGAEELLLIDEGGTARVFSLLSSQFRPATVQLSTTPIHAWSAPDGSCLLVLNSHPESGDTQLQCFHWSSFGSNTGIDLELPPRFPADTECSITSIGHRSSLHFIYLRPEGYKCHSQCLHITHKVSQYAFRSQNERNDGDSQLKTVNNCLIDCHAEVWTRYPVWSPIRHETLPGSQHQRRSITFICAQRPEAFKPYFDDMIRDFERSTRKPTNRQLSNIDVTGVSTYVPGTDVSQIQAGDWLATLFCLIPIHIAITSQNRFIPLKDGVLSSKFEDSVLGFDVSQIATALSVGFYESIFTSYMANKPVRVVTSMGEQSVGKSYALNHLMDTSFAGSAMRCTEGVWLSATPTRDALIVAMDFEGVHSLERSAQEDALLVLFNVALSNLVLFRNNFAFSRDIAGLFTSFQSSSKVLDPAANPSLFRSTLAIIIKDVIDSDTREIVKEFQSKFQSIVEAEGASNFMTTLHRGNVDILPWPIINSPSFYKLFSALKLRLDGQPITHQTAREFLRVLKTLMAKLKTNDWGALDQNMGVQRAQHLRGILPTALAFGVTEPENGGEPLKNLDNDEPLGPSTISVVLYVPHTSSEGLSPDGCLQQLRQLWVGRLDRYKLEESDFISRYNGFLNGLVKERLDLVGGWLQVNTERFSDHSEVQALMRAFREHAEEMKDINTLCGARCSSCGLLCLEMRRHEGDHDCKTSHQCPRPCEFLEQHIDINMDLPPTCKLPAAHTGSHFCEEGNHVCGQVCKLRARDGCLGTCSRAIGHSEEEHLCASQVHACGMPCDLQVDGVRCARTCVYDCTKPHENHCCELIRTCPVKCKFKSCSRSCAEPDHFHALDNAAIHLCGQEHDCPELCQQPGICEIKTAPQAVESTFIGRFGRHQYTKYTQQARRQLCVIRIPANKETHEGAHIHLQDPNAFHFCEERCRYCRYYCTLPLSHPQQEHDTRHGSMEQTTWFLEEEREGVDVGGHKYGSGDSGAPMLCSLVCSSMGRHVHVADCIAGEHGQCTGGAEVEHIATVRRNGVPARDWVTHNLYWRRSGFKDVYSQAEQTDFAKCDRQCPGEEHDASKTSGAAPSFCTLPLFHQPAANSAMANSINGHVSADGHIFPCKNPALMQRAFHVIFVIDQSGSMGSSDNRPLANSPVTQLIVQRQNNRFGAALSSLYSFCKAREEAVRQGAATGARRDAYSVILFDQQATVRLTNDFTSSPEQVINHCLNKSGGGTNFDAALKSAQGVMESNWSTERSPVIVFLSDGECSLPDRTTYDICNSAVRLGKSLSFYTVSFGPDGSSQSLRRMAQIAEEVYRRAPRDPLAPAVQDSCSYTRAIDTIRLAETFLHIANSLKGKRAALHT